MNVPKPNPHPDCSREPIACVASRPSDDCLLKLGLHSERAWNRSADESLLTSKNKLP